MKCPILAAAKWAVGEIVLDTMSDCLLDECAWWDETAKQCDPTGLMDPIIKIQSHLSNIAKNLPPRATL